MPWDVLKDSRCQPSIPWGVVKQGTNELVACHPTREKALAQQAALYANERADMTLELRYSASHDVSACPGDAPYAVKDSAGNLIACHSRMDAAEKHAASMGAAPDEHAPMKGAMMSVPRPTTRANVGTERRSITEMEARQASDGSWTVAGYASTFSDPYTVRDQYGTFTEQIMPGAWDRSLSNRGHKIQLLAGHEGLPYGSTKAKNLTLNTDAHGLAFAWQPNPRSVSAMDIAERIADGSIDEMSVGMRIPEGGDTWEGDQRSISEATLMEISVVARGANPNTEAGLREEKILAEIRKLEGLISPESRTANIDDAVKRVMDKARYYNLGPQ